MTKSAAEVESEVEASRDRLDQTVEALKQRMTPDHLIDDAATAMSGVGQQVFSKLVEQAKANPMPLAVIGVGLAWLMTTSVKSSTSSPSGTYGGSSQSGGGLRDKLQQLGGKASDMVSGVKDKASDMVGGVKDKVTQAASSAGDTIGQAMHGGGEGGSGDGLASSMMDRGTQLGQQAVQGLGGILDREPLIFAAVGLAVGAALGAALPSTELENRTVGGARDQLLEKGKSLAQDSMDQVKQTAASTIDAVKSELEKPEHQGAGLQDKIQAVATASTQTVKEHIGANT